MTPAPKPKGRLRKWLLSLLLLLVFGGLSLWAADWLLGYRSQQPYRDAAAVAGVELDSRDRLQALIDYRAQGPNWHPAVPANTFINKHLRVGDDKLLPLTGMPNANILGCSEEGYYSTYQTDELGFKNPAGSWSDPSTIKLFFVGDSFTQGSCLNQGDGFVDQLRQSWPGIVTVASGGNGPLLELASIREYLPRPFNGTVIWSYFEGNDLMDLERDSGDDLLIQYLQPDFSQGLLANREQVNAALAAYIDRRFSAKIAGRPWFLPHIRDQIWKLRFRNKGGQPAAPAQSTAEQAAEDDRVARLTEVIGQARDEIEAAGGQFLFVYLPEYERYNGSGPSDDAKKRPQLLAALQQAGITSIDLTPAFDSHPDPLGLFSLRMKAHYNHDGYALVTDAIDAQLSRMVDVR